jgi:hypothetical protein
MNQHRADLNRFLDHLCLFRTLPRTLRLQLPKRQRCCFLVLAGLDRPPFSPSSTLFCGLWTDIIEPSFLPSSTTSLSLSRYCIKLPIHSPKCNCTCFDYARHFSLTTRCGKSTLCLQMQATFSRFSQVSIEGWVGLSSFNGEEFFQVRYRETLGLKSFISEAEHHGFCSSHYSQWGDVH